IVKERGIKVTGVSGEYVVKDNLHPVLAIEDLPDDLDLVFLVTKLNDIEDAIKRLENKLSSNYTLITMTNGMIEERFCTEIGSDHLLGCVTSFGATKTGHAEADKTSSGEMVIGRLDGNKRKVDDQILEILSATVPITWSNNVRNEKFSKLLINLSVASFGVISGMTLGDMLQRRTTRIAFLTVLTEGVKVADLKGIEIQKLNNLNLSFLALKKKELHGFSIKHFLQHLIIKMIGKKYKDLKSSSLQSIERGKKTEIDFLNGYLVAEGEKYGVETPLNRYVQEAIHVIEQGKQNPSLEGLKLLEEKTKEIWGL
ncbi:MAG: ketopantoate reductase family protein, partial [Candidatus Heimdallarchaeaceae archaeon]